MHIPPSLKILRFDEDRETTVTLAAKKTGDYSALSAADLSILAITSALHDEAVVKAEKNENGKNEATVRLLGT